MTDRILIRPYQHGDLARANAIWERVPPYRPGDEAEVEAMYQRAQRARESGDNWIPHSGGDKAHSQGWVAVLTSDAGEGRVVGFAEVVASGEMEQMPQDMPLAQEWRQRDDVAQLSRLSVDPEVWRSGVGTRLSRTAIEWCRDQGFRTLVLNTTSPQKPALALYHNLGFRIVARSYIDRYELVWHELAL